MKNKDNILFLVLVIIIVALIFFLIFRNKSQERYWALPFGGGAVRTNYPDPKKIEGPIGREMDRADMDEGDNDYPM